MMAKTHLLFLLTWAFSQAVGTSDAADTCVAVRPCDNTKNIKSVESAMDKKLAEQKAITKKLQAALNSLVKQTSVPTCYTGDGRDYRGTVAKTISGKTCQRWLAQSPHKHTRTPARNPDKGLEENFCRNPDGERMPWCYTTDPKKRWEDCPVPRCDDGKMKSLESAMDKKLAKLQAALDSLVKQTAVPTCYTGDGRNYRGTVAKTISGKTCQRWLAQSPHRHNRTPARNPDKGLEENYCRNPDGERMPWCYTTDPKKRWEDCPVPRCDEAGLKVGFSASLAGRSNVHIGPAGSQTIVFKNVFFNNGNAYNPATGIFTAPLKGAFQFTFTTFGYSAYYSGARLLKNGQLQVSTWQARGKHHSDSTSGAVILKLNAGDKVNLITWAWANMQVFDNLNHHTTFSGVLLFPL